MYVVDRENHCIRSVTSQGFVKNVCGNERESACVCLCVCVCERE